jgi:hypothetical protein
MTRSSSQDRTDSSRRPLKWWELARSLPYLFNHITAFVIILRKPDRPVAVN